MMSTQIKCDDEKKQADMNVYVCGYEVGRFWLWLWFYGTYMAMLYGIE